MTKFIKDENGQGMLEYVLIIALVALVAVVALLLVKNFLKGKNDAVSEELSKADVK